jgi:THO complex subunit 1
MCVECVYVLLLQSQRTIAPRCNLPELQHASVQGMVDSNGEPVDAAFYRRFWGLQPVFMNPGPAMRPAPWAGVMNDLTAVLEEFDKQKTIAAASSAPDAEGVTVFLYHHCACPLRCCRSARIATSCVCLKLVVIAGGELPAAKYLSSPKLMRLQLQDATFRRHFLVQVRSMCLIDVNLRS